MRPRLQALYRMTGGNPRLTMMLYELIAHESVTSVQRQFHLLLDRISPFYQGRLNDLPPGQRALLECLASMRDQEKTPAAIAARMRMRSAGDFVAAQASLRCPLPALSPTSREIGVHASTRFARVSSISGSPMNLSRGARKRLPFLLEFFSLFYPSLATREEKRRQLRKKLLDEGSPDAERALDYLSEVGDKRGSERSQSSTWPGIFARLGVAEQAMSYVLEAAPLAGDRVSRSIARIVASDSVPLPTIFSKSRR